MERNNNTCKLVKRISFGFRNFKNMKARIMIITNIFRKEKREYQAKYSIPKYSTYVLSISKNHNFGGYLIVTLIIYFII